MSIHLASIVVVFKVVSPAGIDGTAEEDGLLFIFDHLADIGKADLMAHEAIRIKSTDFKD